MDFKTAATSDGQRFVYSDTGEGPLVVLLHGFPDLPTGWADSAAVLNAAGYRTLVPHLRGYHPDTIVPGRGYSDDEIAADPVALMDAVGADKAVLIGHDWGAAVTYRAAALAPERFRAICAVAIPHPAMIRPSSGLLWKGRHFVTLKLPTGKLLARSRDFRHIDTLISRWAPYWSGPDRDACLRDIKRAFSDPVVLDGALGYYRDTQRSPVPRLSQPALVVGGTTDLLDPDLFRRSPERFDGPCDVLIAEGAGHWPHREAAPLFQERLLAWLGGLPAV